MRVTMRCSARGSLFFGALGLATLVFAALLPISSAEASFCTEFSTRTFDCNCHLCDCETCHTCECESKLWSDCDFDACPDDGCWCTPVCHCCYESNCRSQCDCKSCCDTCTETTCAREIHYSLHSVEPTFVQASAPTPVIVTGGYFVNTPHMKCRFGTTVVDAELISNNALRCTPPARVVAEGDTLVDAVQVSLDGESWTNNTVMLTYVSCAQDCSGHGTCDAASHCVCEALYTGANCSKLCPVDAGGTTCSGNGVCTRGGTCQCDAGYWGPLCSRLCPIGLGGSVCSGSDHGQCSTETGLCVCLPGFTGDTCQHTGTCQEHGTNCTCSEKGYWGVACSSTCPGSTDCVEGTGCATTCSNHGLCTDEGTCLCDSGFYGSACESACPSSTADPCSGHSATGTCDAMGHCVCVHGWSGALCDQECPGSAATPCNNHGRCTTSNLCVCDNGYTGSACEIVCPVANNSVCGGHGTCDSLGQCQCNWGYYGTACESECPGGAATPCNQHGTCNNNGQCVCSIGYYGDTCADECNGGANTPCSNHGTCDPATGQCNCDLGYWGADCANACPSGAGAVCSGHGSCGTDGACKCNAPYKGAACDEVYCPNNCYNHGSCDSNGVCHCQGPWSGIYCSKAVDDPLDGAASFQFAKNYVRTQEDAGTIVLNVTRGGSSHGEVYVSYSTQDVSAHAHQDYLPTAGQLLWASGDGQSKSIAIDIIGDTQPEGVEAFLVYLHSPSPGSSVGDNATVAISANGDALAADDSVVVTVLVMKAEEDLLLSSPDGAQFADDFIADMCGPNVLDIPTTRMVVRDVQAQSATESYYTFVLLAADSGPTADSLAETTWEAVRDPGSALYSGTASRYIDINFQPVFKFAVDDTPSPTTYWWLLGIFIPLVLLGVCAFFIHRNKAALTEWALWKLGNMRFRSLMKHRTFDDTDDIDTTDSPRTGGGIVLSPGDDIRDDRL